MPPLLGRFIFFYFFDKLTLLFASLFNRQSNEKGMFQEIENTYDLFVL